MTALLRELQHNVSTEIDKIKSEMNLQSLGGSKLVKKLKRTSRKFKSTSKPLPSSKSNEHRLSWPTKNSICNSKLRPNTT